MSQSRTRRITRWIVAGVLSPVLLLCLYVSAYLAAAWFEGHQYGGQPVIRNSTFFGPLREYAASNAPGSLEFKAAEMYFVNEGKFPFEQMYTTAKELREAGRLSSQE